MMMPLTKVEDLVIQMEEETWGEDNQVSFFSPHTFMFFHSMNFLDTQVNICPAMCRMPVICRGGEAVWHGTL